MQEPKTKRQARMANNSTQRHQTIQTPPDAINASDTSSDSVLKDVDFIHIPAWMYKLDIDSATELIVFSKVYHLATARGSKTYCTLRYLSEVAVCTRRNVSIVIDKLCVKGLLEHETGVTAEGIACMHLSVTDKVRNHPACPDFPNVVEPPLTHGDEVSTERDKGKGDSVAVCHPDKTPSLVPAAPAPDVQEQQTDALVNTQQPDEDGQQQAAQIKTVYEGLKFYAVQRGWTSESCLQRVMGDAEVLYNMLIAEGKQEMIDKVQDIIRLYYREYTTTQTYKNKTYKSMDAKAWYYIVNGYTTPIKQEPGEDKTEGYATLIKNYCAWSWFAEVAYKQIKQEGHINEQITSESVYSILTYSLSQLPVAQARRITMYCKSKDDYKDSYKTGIDISTDSKQRPAWYTDAMRGMVMMLESVFSEYKDITALHTALQDRHYQYKEYYNNKKASKAKI